jgi:hypothetical protein
MTGPALSFSIALNVGRYRMPLLLMWNAQSVAAQVEVEKAQSFETGFSLYSLEG